MFDNENQLDYHIYKSYEVIGLIGKGTYGQVYKVKHKKSQQIFAIKKICDVYQNITDAKRTYRQLNYLFQLSHPCIVKLFQVISTNKRNYGLPNRQTNTSRTEFFKGLVSQESMGYSTQKIQDTYHSHNNKMNKHVYALFEFIETDLSKALRICSMQLIQRKYITYQLLHGLAYMHKSKLIHRDIKPSNILIDSNCDVKICDFGLCRLKQSQTHQENNQQNIITEYVASRWYRPPEILLGFSPCNQAIDIWGIGCVIAELILRQPLFQGGTTMDQLQKIFRLIGLPSQHDISRLQTEHAKFILRNFTFSRKNKPQKMNQVLSEASDQQLDLIQKLLKFNPQQRLSAQLALRHPYFGEMKQMNYNFESYSFPVKITDHTEPSTFLSDLKSFNYQDQKKKISQKNSKNKQITLQHYQSLIEQLQRATSRSSNRVYQQQIYEQNDKIIQPADIKNKVKLTPEQYFKQKSTRESNFLLKQQKFQKQKQKVHKNQQKIPIENYSILQKYQREREHEKLDKLSASQKIINHIKENRNAYSTNDNYNQSNLIIDKMNYQTLGDKFIKKQAKYIDINNQMEYNRNKKIEQNLEEHYGKYFNPLLQRGNIKNDRNQKIVNNNKKSNNKTISSVHLNKSSNGKNVIKIVQNQNLLQQNKNKYASFSSLNYQLSGKGKLSSNSFKKNNQKDDSVKFKDISKSKYFSGGSNKGSNKNVHLKSSQNLKNDSSLNKISNKRQRKKSKDLVSSKPLENNTKQSSFKHTQNCFSRIQIVSKKQKNSNQLNSNTVYSLKNPNVPKDPNKNSTNDLKKTLQKKSKNKLTSKSIGKKKSQTKIQ